MLFLLYEIVKQRCAWTPTTRTPSICIVEHGGKLLICRSEAIGREFHCESCRTEELFELSTDLSFLQKSLFWRAFRWWIMATRVEGKCQEEKRKYVWSGADDITGCSSYRLELKDNYKSWNRMKRLSASAKCWFRIWTLGKIYCTVILYHSFLRMKDNKFCLNGDIFLNLQKLLYKDNEVYQTLLISLLSWRIILTFMN